MIPVERNEVDIRPLFEWSKSFEIVDEAKNLVHNLYIRLLGDADLNRARVQALRQSAELRRQLRDENSDERLAYIPEISEMAEDQLITLIVLLNMRNLTKVAIKNVRIKVPKQPDSSASTEKLEKYQKEVDDYPGKRTDSLKKELEKEADKMKEDLSKLSKEDLYKSYVIAMVNELCEQKVTTVFKDYCVFYGTFADEELTVPYFKTMEEYLNLQTELKLQFVSAYQSLEHGGDELKKSLRATQS